MRMAVANLLNVFWVWCVVMPIHIKPCSSKQTGQNDSTSAWCLPFFVLFFARPVTAPRVDSYMCAFIQLSIEEEDVDKAIIRISNTRDAGPMKAQAKKIVENLVSQVLVAINLLKSVFTYWKDSFFEHTEMLSENAVLSHACLNYWYLLGALCMLLTRALHVHILVYAHMQAWLMPCMLIYMDAHMQAWLMPWMHICMRDSCLLYTHAGVPGVHGTPALPHTTEGIHHNVGQSHMTVLFNSFLTSKTILHWADLLQSTFFKACSSSTSDIFFWYKCVSVMYIFSVQITYRVFGRGDVLLLDTVDSCWAVRVVCVCVCACVRVFLFARMPTCMGCVAQHLPKLT